MRTKESKRIRNRIFGVGVPDVNRALAFGAECILQFLQLPKGRQKRAHPRIRYSSHGTPFYNEICTAMRTGITVPDGEVQGLSCKQQFAKSLGIEIEPRHGRTKQIFVKSHNHGEAMVSAHNRKREVFKNNSDVAIVARFIGHLSTCSSVPRRIGCLGLHQHP